MKDSATIAPDAASQQPAPAEKHQRTRGLWLFDFLVYPLFTNITVFAISVAATYLTARGNDHGRIGAFFQRRGDWLVKKFESTGMTKKQADMSKMVFFSFADGSLLAPFVKMLEDRREKIGRWFDHKLGTEPKDDGVYEAEPKHSWLSVLGGRFITAAIVVPTAVLLDKLHIFDKKLGKDIPLNDKLFNNPGAEIGEWLSTKPKIIRWLGKLDPKELFRVAAFEAFYTSVCTAGLYLTSRRIARFVHRNDPPPPEAAPAEHASCAPAAAEPQESLHARAHAAPAASFGAALAAERLAASEAQNALAH